MGWLWGSNDIESKGDAYKNLDPKLREFLDKEAPSKYTTAEPTSSPRTVASPDGASNEFRSQLGLSSPASPYATQPDTTTPAVPQESLFQDGRYAQLWANYRPLAAQEAAQTDQDKLASVIDAYKDRKARIGRAAMENCIFEQLAEKECFDRGGFHAKMTMCRAEARVFNRCYTMQARFLKALGYMGMDRTEDEEERIQMHADKLYQEMLEREKIGAAAREKGLPEPVWSPLLKVQGEKGLEAFPEEKRKAIETELKGKTPQEREFEIQLRLAEAKAGEEYAGKIGQYFEDDRARRQDRRERGKETVSDSIKRAWGWDK